MMLLTRMVPERRDGLDNSIHYYSHYHDVPNISARGTRITQNGEILKFTSAALRHALFKMVPYSPFWSIVALDRAPTPSPQASRLGTDSDWIRRARAKTTVERCVRRRSSTTPGVSTFPEVGLRKQGCIRRSGGTPRGKLL